MRVSLQGISNQTFYDRLLSKRIYCRSASSWIERLFERPLQINLNFLPIDATYRIELNGMPLGHAENFSDGVLFNVFTEIDLYTDCVHFLNTSCRYGYTLSIYHNNTLHHSPLLIEYFRATSTTTHIKDPAIAEDSRELIYYKMINFEWETKKAPQGNMTTNPLRELRAEMSELRRAESDQNLRDIRRMSQEMKEKYEAAEQKKPDEPAPLPSTRNITICK